MSACHEKAPFATREAAEGRIEQIRSYTPLDPHLRPYHCHDCGCWHLYTDGGKSDELTLYRDRRIAAAYFLDRLRGSRAFRHYPRRRRMDLRRSD